MFVELKQLRDSGYFFVNGHFQRDPQFQLPDEPDVLLHNGTVLKDSRSVITGFDPEKKYFIKIYKKNGCWRTLKRMFQFPRSYRCLSAALRLKQLKIATPEVLYASRYCLITEVLDESVRFANSCPEVTPDLIRFVALLHKNGMKHGDLNLRNIYCWKDSFGLIDMDGVNLYAGEVPYKVRFLELARVISSALKDLHFTEETLQKHTKEWAILYKQETGFDLYGDALIRRVRELAGRR